jgi:thioredoxin-related protein
MRFRSLTTLLGLLLFASTTAAQEWKDLQVLPRNISKADMKTIMKAQSKALGVDCDFCHQMPTPEKETAKKKTARTMMRMVNDINAKYLLAVQSKTTCATCHRGKAKPDEVAK